MRHRRSRRVGQLEFRFLNSCHHPPALSPQLTLQTHIMSSSLLSHKSIRLQKNTRGATSLDKNGEVRPDHALTARLQQAKHITKSILHYYKVSHSPAPFTRLPTVVAHPSTPIGHDAALAAGACGKLTLHPNTQGLAAIEHTTSKATLALQETIQVP